MIGRRSRRFAACALSVVAAITVLGSDGARAEDGLPGSDAARIAQGFRIAPVRLRLRGLDAVLVGLGSYIVNAQGGCNDCHTNPPYAPGHNPFQGQPKQFNAARYLAGGTSFGPDLVSPNLTPDSRGLPAGLTLRQFIRVIRTGHDPDNPRRLLQVMPWPVYQGMTDRDLRAIYEYLRAIPSRPGNRS